MKLRRACAFIALCPLEALPTQWTHSLPWMPEWAGNDQKWRQIPFTGIFIFCNKNFHTNGFYFFLIKLMTHSHTSSLSFSFFWFQAKFLGLIATLPLELNITLPQQQKCAVATGQGKHPHFCMWNHPRLDPKNGKREHNILEQRIHGRASRSRWKWCQWQTKPDIASVSPTLKTSFPKKAVSFVPI